MSHWIEYRIGNRSTIRSFHDHHLTTDDIRNLKNTRTSVTASTTFILSFMWLILSQMSVKIQAPSKHALKYLWCVCWYSYNETNVSVDRNGLRLLEWKHHLPMLYYWFSLGADDGYITWSANCEPEGKLLGHCILIMITLEKSNLPPSQWRQYDSPKYGYPSTKLHGIICHLLFTSINPIRSTNSHGCGNRLGYKLVQGATCRTIIEH
jgi:hypothetical protein